MIEVNHVVKNFGSFRALSGVDMNVPDGAVYGLVGPNGADCENILQALRDCGAVASNEGIGYFDE